METFRDPGFLPIPLNPRWKDATRVPSNEVATLNPGAHSSPPVSFEAAAAAAAAPPLPLQQCMCGNNFFEKEAFHVRNQSKQMLLSYLS